MPFFTLFVLNSILVTAVSSQIVTEGDSVRQADEMVADESCAMQAVTTLSMLTDDNGLMQSVRMVSEENCALQAVKIPSRLWSLDDSTASTQAAKDGDSFEHTAASENAKAVKPASPDPPAAHNSSALNLAAVSNSSSAAVNQSSSSAPLGSGNSSQVHPAPVSSITSEAAVAVSNASSKLTLATVQESSGQDTSVSISNSLNGSGAPTANNPDLLAQPVAGNASSDLSILEHASFADSGALVMEHREDSTSATAALPPDHAVNSTRPVLLSQRAMTSLVSQAVAQAGGREVVYAVVILMALGIFALVVLCSLDARSDSASSSYRDWHGGIHPRAVASGHLSKSNRILSQRTSIRAGSGIRGAASDDDFLAAHFGTNPQVPGLRQSAQRLSCGSLSSPGDRGPSAPSARALPAQLPSATSPAFIHEDYVVPAGSECHLALPSLKDKYNFEAQQPITDPEGSILFYVGFVRDAESNENLVLWDAGRERVGCCTLAVEGRIGEHIISNSRGQKHAVVQAQPRGKQVDASRRYLLRRLTPGGSWRLACGEQFKPVWIYDDDRPVAKMAFDGSAYQVFMSPNTDVCMLILFVLCCECLHVMASVEPVDRPQRPLAQQ
jgi:hypothetical protein